ncbi:gamma-glutamyl-phosphate reductase, partial [Streptococcus danieliae]|nr:gamma-glutamyl-phosphate reductase [Streptococcus danieliae]
EQATVPVIETGTGLCHVYIDQQVDLEMAVALAVNAKTSRPSVCNAAEVLLVHQDIAADFLPAFEAALADKVELRADASAQ